MILEILDSDSSLVIREVTGGYGRTGYLDSRNSRDSRDSRLRFQLGYGRLRETGYLNSRDSRDSRVSRCARLRF